MVFIAIFYKGTKMSKHISFGKIPQYRDLVRSVAKISQFEGLDQDGNAVYNTDPLPTLNVQFTIKLHGFE